MEIENSILLTAVRNPFQPHSSRLILKREYKVQTVGEYIKEIFPIPPEDIEIIASVSNIGIVDLDYIPLPQTNIVFTTIPAGGGGNQNMRIIASIAVMIVAILAPYSTPAIAAGMGAGTMGGTFLSAGIAIGGSLLINAILPLQQPGEQASSPSYSWSGVNSVNEGGAFPVIYGTAKMLPTFIGIYMENIGGANTLGKQALNILCAIADHSVSDITDIKINGSDYTAYKDVSVDATRLGSLSQTVIPKFRDTYTSQAYAIKMDVDPTNTWSEAYDVPGSDITGIKVGIGLPNGCGYFNSDGNIEWLSPGWSIQFRVKDVGGGTPGTWQNWIRFQLWEASSVAFRVEASTLNNSYNNNESSWKGFWDPTPPLIRAGASLSPDEYQIRWKFLGSLAANRNHVMDTYIDYIAGIVEDDFRYPGTSLLSVYAMATDQLSGGLPTISCVVARGNITVWEQDGTPHTVASSNPAWACYDVLVNAEYGANTSYTRINYTEFLAWATFCDTNGYTCNIIFDTNMSITEALARISILGRGHVIQRGTNFGVIIDQTDSAVQLFTVGNIIEDSFKISYLSKTDRVNVIETTYFDADLDYEQRSFELRTSDFETSADENKTELVLYGATSKSVALKLTKFLLNCNEYLKTTCEFEVQVDALAATVGDVILVSHDVPQWGYSGRVVSATSNTIVLDREVTYGDGLATVYHIIVRHYDDDALEEVVITNPGSEITSATLNLTGTWSQIPVVDDVYAFGVIDYVYKEFRVTKISRSQDMFRKINALEYNAAVYSDAASIPDYEDDSALLPFVEGLVAIEIFKKEDGIIKTIVSLSWRGFGLNYLYYKEETADRWVLIDSYSGQTWATVRNLDSGKTYIFAVSTTANPLGDGVYDTITLGEYIEPRLIHIWRVGGLQIVGQGNNTVWQNRDLKLTWNLSTQWFPETADGDAQGAGSFPPMTDFGGYRIKISDQNANVRREFIQTENFFNYTYEKNSEDGLLGLLSFLSGTGTFLAGEWIYQFPSGAYAKIHSVGGSSLQLTNVVGTFVDGQIIYQADYGDDLIYTDDFTDAWWESIYLTKDDANTVTVTGSPDGMLYTSSISVSYPSYFKFDFTPSFGSVSSPKFAAYDLTADEFIFSDINQVDGTLNSRLFAIPTGCTSLRVYPLRKQSSNGTMDIDGVSVKQITNAAIASGTVTFASSGSSADPEPNLIVQVWARDRFGQESEVPATLSVSNPAPAAPSGLSSQAFMRSVWFTWQKNTDIDFDYYKFRSKISTGDWSEWTATQDPEQIIQLSETEIETYGSDAQIYFEVKAVDTFGNESSASSTNVASLTLDIKASDINDYAITASKRSDKLIVLTGDSWTNNSDDGIPDSASGYIYWNTHTLVYDGASYSIEAGNTNLSYIWWNGSSTAYSTSSTNPGNFIADGQFVIATNVSGVHDLAWNGFANIVVGSAFIELASIVDAHIGSVSADKINVGTLTGLNIIGNIIKTSSSGKRVEITDNGIDLIVTDNVAAFYNDSSAKYGDSDYLYGSGSVAVLNHMDQSVPFYVVGEQPGVADFHFYPRSTTPTGTVEIADVVIDDGQIKICTAGGGSGGTWKTPLEVEQQVHEADASTSHALNATFDDTEVEAALNALGTKINNILSKLESTGLLASS